MLVRFQRHKNNMEYIAIAKNIKISPRKMRLVANEVKKQNISNALASLTVMNKRAAGPIQKALNSAIANAANNFNARKDALSIHDIIITEGLAAKRFHFAGRGRSRPYKRRQSHIRVVLTDGSKAAQAPVVQGEVVNEKVEAKEVKAETKKGKSK